MNGNSSHSSLKRDPNASPADQEFKKNVDFLQRGKVFKESFIIMTVIVSDFFINSELLKFTGKIWNFFNRTLYCCYFSVFLISKMVKNCKRVPFFL